jgi:PKHD-type hydroxylase
MNGEWCYFRSYFTPGVCKYILDLGLKLPAQDATLGVAGENQDNSYRRSKIRFIQKDNPDFQFLFDELWKMARLANNDWFNFHLSDITYLQLAEYDSSYIGEYKKHHDVFWMNNDPKLHRKLTCVLQLTDPSEYEGGDFELYDLTSGQYPNKQEIKEQGTAVFIPSFITHAALPVTKGTRYSIAAWFDGPKWR